MPAKDRPGPSHDNTCCAFMANSGMVLPSSELADNAATAVQSRENVLANPLVGTAHPTSSKLVLMACKLLGDACLAAKFRQTLPTSSSNLGDQVRKNSSQFTSTDGTDFVTKGKLIQSFPQ